MSGWLLGIVGVVFLGVLFDLICPKGKTNTLCKSIFGIFALFVMIMPILNIDIDSIVESTTYGNVMQSILNARDNSLQAEINNRLESLGIIGVNVEIKSKIDKDEYKIDQIYVDSTNIVLTENLKNINKYEVIAKEIADVVDIDIERIIVYG